MLTTTMAKSTEGLVNGMLRGELAAVETYEQALRQFQGRTQEPQGEKHIAKLDEMINALSAS